MKCVEFEGQTLLLQPPPNMERGTCGALPVSICGDSIFSFWKPSPEELAALNEGKYICLQVVGVRHPPVAIHVQDCTELP